MRAEEKLNLNVNTFKDKSHLSLSFELIARSKKSSLAVINLLLRNLYGYEHENWRQTTKKVFSRRGIILGECRKCRAAVDARHKRHEGRSDMHDRIF